MEKSNKTTAIIAGVVALVVIGGGVLWATSSSNEETETPTASQSQQAEETTEQASKKTADIVGIASETPSLSTLVTAVKAASLVETLQSAGPFTVFAPTNDAFTALPAGTLDTLLMPENVEQLKSILTDHVVSGKVLAADLKDGQIIDTVQGGKLTVKLMDGMVYLIDAKGGQVTVQKADVNAGNGVVHVISGVLMHN